MGLCIYAVNDADAFAGTEYCENYGSLCAHALSYPSTLSERNMDDNVIQIDFSDEAFRERYELVSERIEQFPGELKGAAAEYFSAIRNIALLCRKEMKEKLHNKAVNEALYYELSDEGFKTSFLDVEYAAERFGSLGTLLSAFYAEFRGIIPFAYENRIKDITVILETVMQLYTAFEEHIDACRTDIGGRAEDKTEHRAGHESERDKEPERLRWVDDKPEPYADYDKDSFAEEIREIIYSYIYDYTDEFVNDYIARECNPSYSFAKDIVMNADLDNVGENSYLYSYGEYITEEELGTARLMSELGQEQIESMARAYTEGYIRGFKMTGKDVSLKSTVSCYLPLGFERFMREAVKQFEAAGLKVIINRNPVHLINKKNNVSVKPGFYGACSRICDFEHREDLALFWGDKLKSRKLLALKAAYEEHKELLKGYSGRACVEIFGKSGVSPRREEHMAAFDEHQLKVTREYAFKAHEISQQYMPDEETSFTIIAWPTPSIAGALYCKCSNSINNDKDMQGTADTRQCSQDNQDADSAALSKNRNDKEAAGSRFEELYRKIFERFIDINTLPVTSWQQIQQCIIDALDTAEYIEVKGTEGNDTDIRISMHALSKPDKETNFENCLADVNIPAGEVFTSPVLKGTNGILHAGYVYIGGYLFKNLKISFTDGRVSAYSCENYEDEDEGRRLIEHLIFKDRQRLPMGEFAIGTNTIAYAAATEYDIADKMPVLIAEKTGPHFAVGDTCYSYEEDMATYNPDGKQITARENECSALRKIKPEQAYFSVHTDITLPYDELKYIRAVGSGRSTAIIEDGRFVLPGTEALNEALEKC